jgi:uncharacterized protein with HEPN domain
MKPTKAYLEDVKGAILRIIDYTSDGKSSFDTDNKTQDAVARNFEIIGEVVKRLPNDLLAGHTHIPWRAIARFRDVLIHDYDEIDLDEVWLTIEQDLPPLLQAVESLLDELNKPNNHQ